MEYRVQQRVFSGPLDLLLHLVRQKEVDIQEVSIARLLQEYLAHLSALRTLDVNNVGEFLVLASELMEIKSRELLPREDLDLEEELDPRSDLIRRLLEFKRYRDLARRLGLLAGARSRMAGRGMAGVEPSGQEEVVELDLQDADVWVLLKAYARLLEETGYQREYRVEVADVPVRLYIQRVLDRLGGGRQAHFDTLVGPEEGREGLVGVFLALLELVRGGWAAVCQEGTERILVTCQAPEGTRADDVLGAGPREPDRP